MLSCTRHLNQRRKHSRCDPPTRREAYIDECSIFYPERDEEKVKTNSLSHSTHRMILFFSDFKLFSRLLSRRRFTTFHVPVVPKSGCVDVQYFKVTCIRNEGLKQYLWNERGRGGGGGGFYLGVVTLTYCSEVYA